MNGRYFAFKRIAEEVKQERKKLNLTQSEFAKLTGTSLLVINQIESGNKIVSYNSLKKIATFLNNDVYMSLFSDRTITLDKELYNYLKEKSDKNGVSIGDYLKSQVFKSEIKQRIVN